MTVSDSALEGLRAYLRQDSDRLDRAMATMQHEGTAESYPQVLAVAMLVLLQRRLGPHPGLSDIIGLVARLRADHRVSDDLDVHPLTTERMIRAGYGDTDALTGYDQEELAKSQLFLIETLATDENLDDTGLENLVTRVRERIETLPA